METFVYRPKGVCSREMRFGMDGNVIRDVTIVGGCADNLLGISRVIKDKKTSEILGALRGVRCRAKPTPCPNQITEALSEYARKLGQAGSLCPWHRVMRA